MSDIVRHLSSGSQYSRSVKNSSSTSLGSSATFTGERELNGFSDVMVTCKADQDGTLYFDFSDTGAFSGEQSVFPVTGFIVTAGTYEFHTAIKGPRYFRVRYVNGSVAQSSFRLDTYYGVFPKPANTPLNQIVNSDADSLIVRAIDSEIDIASGKYAGHSIVNKFGTNSDIDTATVPEDIWEGGGPYTGFASNAETLQVFSSSASDTSAGVGLRTLRITGLDSNYNVISETVTLNGVTPVTTSQSFLRAHTATGLTGDANVGDITIRQSTTTTNVMLTMLAGRAQSNCSAYTIPAGYTAYMRFLHVSVRGSVTASLDGYIWTRTFGQIFRSRRPFTSTSSYRLQDYIYGGLSFSEKSDIVLRISSSSANNVSLNGGYDLLLIKN